MSVGALNEQGLSVENLLVQVLVWRHVDLLVLVVRVLVKACAVKVGGCHQFLVRQLEDLYLNIVHR